MYSVMTMNLFALVRVRQLAFWTFLAQLDRASALPPLSWLASQFLACTPIGVFLELHQGQTTRRVLL